MLSQLVFWVAVVSGSFVFALAMLIVGTLCVLKATRYFHQGSFKPVAPERRTLVSRIPRVATAGAT